MKIFAMSVALAAGLALGACDNNTTPTRAPSTTVDQNPQLDKNPVPRSTTGGDQPGTPPKQ